MKIIRIALTLCSLLILSCIGSEFERERILGDYFIITTDNYNRDIYIGYKLETGDFVGVLPSKIIEIGKNDKFIIAKQSKGAGKESEASYYIIRKMENTVTPENGVSGPYTKDGFQIKIKELGLEDIKFKKVSNLKSDQFI